jgi:hypothetical protein
MAAISTPRTVLMGEVVLRGCDIYVEPLVERMFGQ